MLLRVVIGRPWGAGGWIRVRWTRHAADGSASREDLKKWVDIRGDMKDDIAFFECLAQVLLLALRTKGGGCRGCWLSQGCDNQTSVGALRKKLSTCDPMAAAVQAMAGWESAQDVQVRCDL